VKSKPVLGEQDQDGRDGGTLPELYRVKEGGRRESRRVSS
jgi:hypothetical protein